MAVARVTVVLTTMAFDSELALVLAPYNGGKTVAHAKTARRGQWDRSRLRTGSGIGPIDARCAVRSAEAAPPPHEDRPPAKTLSGLP